MEPTDDTTTPRAPEQAEPPDAQAGKRRTVLGPIHRSTWMLLLAGAITVASMVVAAELGALMGAFGLGWGALGLAIVLMLAGILVRRQALLPLSMVATALTLPAAAVTLTQPPIDRSVGTLIVRPTTLSEIDGKTFRRGAGSILLDLRGLDVPNGATITARVQADLGRVVVALPRDRCFHTTVDAARLPLTRTPMHMALQAIGKGHLSTALGTVVTQGVDNPSNGFRRAGRIDFEAATLTAFGRTRDNNNDGLTARYERRGAPGAPSLTLQLHGNAASIVRDYPDHVGPLTPAGQVYPQVGDMYWPWNVQLPLQPGEELWADRWSRKWTKTQIARRVPSMWAAWERRSIAAQAAQARRAAGVCASRRELATYWSTRTYGPAMQLAVYDISARAVDPTTLVDALASSTPLFDELGNRLQSTARAALERETKLPSEYLLSVNGLGQVERFERRADGRLIHSTMTAANPAGLR